jgi:hypothetical protein
VNFLSSIFSSETLHIRRGVPASWIVTASILAALEFGVSRPEWIYRQLPFSYVGNFLQLEGRLYREPEPPLVLALGNSRTSAISPRTLEQELDLPQGSVVMVDFGGGDSFDALLLLRRNRERLKHVKLIIFGLDNFQFDSKLPVDSERFLHFASLRERIQYARGWSTLVGAFWRTYDKNALYLGLGTRLIKIALGRPVPQVIDASDVAEEQVPEEMKAALRGDTLVARDAARRFEHYTISSPMVNYMAEFLRECNSEPRQVIVVQLPLLDRYMRIVRRDYAVEYDTYKRTVAALDQDRVVFFEEASATGLADSDFVDYGHLTRDGAERFTRFFAQWMRANRDSAVRALKTHSEAAIHFASSPTSTMWSDR